MRRFDTDECYQHLKERLKERYNIFLSREDFYALAYRVRTGIKVKLLKYEEDNMQEVFLVELDNQDVVLVYCMRRGTVTTALPKEGWTERITKVKNGHVYWSDGRGRQPNA